MLGRATMSDDGTSSPAPKRARSRKKKKEPSPNEGILNFLSEMESKAEGNFQYTLRRAIKSVAACPLPIRSREDAGRLKFVGSFIATRIGAFLAANPQSDDPPPATSAPCSASASASATGTRAKREYIPRFRSGPYAILLALLEVEGEGHAYLGKVELGTRAQPHADEPIHDKRGAAKSARYAYDGWSSVGRTLIPKNLVVKAGSPARYSLTDAGRALALRVRVMNDTAQTAIVDTFDPAGAPAASAAMPTAPAPPEPEPRARRPRAPRATPGAHPPGPAQPFGAAAAFDPAQVLLASQVVSALQADGHPRQPCMDALKRVLDGGNIPRTEPALRALVLQHVVASSPLAPLPAPLPASTAPSAAYGSGMASSRPTSALPVRSMAADDDVIVIDSDDGSETLDLIGGASVAPSRAQSTDTVPSLPVAAAPPPPSRAADAVILVLDAREKLGVGAARNCEKFAGKIRAAGIPVEIRALPVGDAVFVRRCSQTGRDTMLDFVVERKTAADYASSVKDGRVLRQSYSMLHSSFALRLFVIEGAFAKENISEKELNVLHKTLAELTVFHGFFVKHTRNTAETVAFYASVHRRLAAAAAKTPLVPGEMELFEEWSARMARFNSGLTLAQLFHLQLCQIPGVGRTRAEAVVAMGFRTPADLVNGFARVSAEQGPRFLTEEAKRKGLKAFPASVSEKIYQLFASRRYDTSMVER